MVAAAVGKEFESAVEHGWQAYQNGIGDVTLETGALGNVGQLFLDAGHPDTAMAAFKVVIARHPSDRIVVPALGGLAVAAARLGLRNVVDATMHEIRLRENTGATAYDIATAMVDLSRAYVTLADDTQAEEFREHAYAIAVSRGFHEIAHHTRESIRTQRSLPRERLLSPRIEAVAADVRQLVSV
jgi:hypothetical protein